VTTILLFIEIYGNHTAGDWADIEDSSFSIKIKPHPEVVQRKKPLDSGNCACTITFSASWHNTFPNCH